MKKSLLFTFIVLVAIGAAAYMWWPVLNQPLADTTPTGDLRTMTIEEYVTNNISALSPQKEVVGGKFYVTNIAAADGRGVVSYEDGHVAYTADFSYTQSDQGYEITSFVIRGNQ